MKNLYLILTIIVLSTLGSCRKDYYGQPPIPAGPISFNTEILPILETNCAKSGCHVPGSQTPDLTTPNAYNNLTGLGYATPDDSLKPAQSILYQKLTGGSKPMPPDGKLSSYNLNLILTWIKQGAKND